LLLQQAAVVAAQKLVLDLTELLAVQVVVAAQITQHRQLHQAVLVHLVKEMLAAQETMITLLIEMVAVVAVQVLAV
jgi:hypothetical protein